MSEDYSSQFQREWPEFLNEVRVTLPGVQLLFGFLLATPFTDRFHEMSRLLRGAYFLSFLFTTCACAFLIAPSVYHRLHWRRDVQDKEQMFLTCNRLAIAGGVMLALAMCGAVFVVSFFIVGRVEASGMTALVGALFAWLWFWLPLSRRNRRQ